MTTKEFTLEIPKNKSHIFFHCRTNGAQFIVHVDDNSGGTILLDLTSNEYEKLYTEMSNLWKNIKK